MANYVDVMTSRRVCSELVYLLYVEKLRTKRYILLIDQLVEAVGNQPKTDPILQDICDATDKLLAEREYIVMTDEIEAEFPEYEGLVNSMPF